MARSVKFIAALAMLAGCAAQPGMSISSPPVPDPPSHRGPRSARPPVTAQPAPRGDPRLDDVERELRELRDRLAKEPPP